MSRKLKVVVVGLLVAGVLSVAAAGIVMAQEPTPTPTPKPFGCSGRGLGFGWGGPGGWATFDAAAKALGLTPVELFQELRAGKTLADLAEAKGVDLQAVNDAMAAAKQEAMRQAIEQAVQDGRLSREQADWMLQGLDQGWMGHGRGFRFFHGWGGPKTAPPPSGSGTRWFRQPFIVPGTSI